MADNPAATLEVAPFPSSEDIDRVAKFTHEPFVADGDDPEGLLAPGTERRRALDAALAELEGGAKLPSIEWRREFSLLLGLERLLSCDEPRLIDGTVLSAHQVDALSGTLTALLAEAQRTGNGNGLVTDAQLELASAGIPGEEDDDEDDEPEEPQDWDGVDVDGQLAEQPE